MGRTGARERWEGLLAKQSGSGLSVAEFCRRNDVAQASFYQWRKKLAEVRSAREAFVPVSITNTAGVRVELPGGAVVCLPAGDERSLAQVISLLTVAREQAEC